jgi:hypothetical protein
VAFLDATTLEGIEGQADALVKVLGTRDDQPRPPVPNGTVAQESVGDWLARARAAKQERQRALLASFVGRPPQPRNALGQFTSTGFDGGARQPVRPAGDPVREHAQVVAQLAGLSKLGRSGF